MCGTLGISTILTFKRRLTVDIVVLSVADPETKWTGGGGAAEV